MLLVVFPVLAVLPACIASESLHEAAWQGDVNQVRQLLSEGADPMARDADGRTALHNAAQTARLEIMRLLLAQGADPDARTPYGRTPLMLAARWGAHYRGRGSSALKLLLDAGADVDARDRAGSTPLHEAAAGAWKEGARALLAAGAQVNAKSKLGTPLDVAAFTVAEDVGQLLLEHGAEHSVFSAAGLGDLESVKSLIEGSPELLHARGYRDYTPLLLAARGHRLKVVEFLLEEGADPDTMTDHGVTALHIAAQGCGIGKHKNTPYSIASLAIARRLLEAGADPNLAEPDRKISPLHWGAIDGNAEIVRLLIEAGAHVNVRDEKGRTPLSYARDAGIRRALREHGAER
jgi:ankyrin repeat protein